MILAEASKEPVCEEEHYEWDEEDYIPDQDMWYQDDTSGKSLPEKLVQEARHEELTFVDQVQVWRLVPRPVGEKVIGTRWVDTNKGDEQSYAVRSRLVGQEIKRKGSIVQYFAATPPLYALKFLMSLAVTVLVPYVKAMYTKRGRYIIQFLDVKKAHWWAKAERTLYVELPWEYKKLHNITDDLVGLRLHVRHA